REWIAPAAAALLEPLERSIGELHELDDAGLARAGWERHVSASMLPRWPPSLPRVTSRAARHSPGMCLWDAETLRELELQASDVGRAGRGFVPKHSPFYFEEKLAYTLPMLDRGAGPERWDDAAVAHEKLGRHDDALRVIDDKDARFPGLYTTYANRGT